MTHILQAAWSVNIVGVWKKLSQIIAYSFRRHWRTKIITQKVFNVLFWLWTEFICHSRNVTFQAESKWDYNSCIAFYILYCRQNSFPHWPFQKKTLPSTIFWLDLVAIEAKSGTGKVWISIILKRGLVVIATAKLAH